MWLAALLKKEETTILDWFCYVARELIIVFNAKELIKSICSEFDRLLMRRAVNCLIE